MHSLAQTGDGTAGAPRRRWPLAPKTLVPRHNRGSVLLAGALLGAQPQRWKKKQIRSSGAFQFRVNRLRSKRSFSPGKEFIVFTARQKEVN